MKGSFRIISIAFASILSIGALNARVGEHDKDGSAEGGKQTLAAGCAPATAATELKLNNVRALIQSGGDMWWDFETAQYEVPKGSDQHSIFAGSLWMGGVDVNEQLKLAALRFRQGNDYWTGPLTVDGDASVDPQTCKKYDQHFPINRGAVQKHKFCTSNPSECPNYEIPETIKNWPAHGDVSKNQDFFLAPFKDDNDNGFYDPENGDYPWYDLEGEIDCKTDRTVTLFGDKTLWWVFNDKGNVHTESQGDPIGMEVKAQAFAFSTNDAVNNMTFYNYELINRGTQTLNETYFAQWVDADLGCFNDDYVGCDVGRGLGYAFNGDNFDENCQGNKGYGSNPPAVGVDFFEGPYQDSTGKDNKTGIGPNQALDGNGIGYGDGIIDNERFGMRHFFFHNNCQSGPRCDPQIATEYYNMMSGFWLDGTRMVYGGNGHVGDPDATDLEADFMFPGSSDPKNWGTGGEDPGFPWTEVSAGNQPGDRRFLQSAGPFTLKPGDVNNITVGVVWARAASGDAQASVQSLKVADEKAQSLFDNCFEVLDGPHAPELNIQELDKELILTLSNPGSSNNANEDYAEVDPFIPEQIVETNVQYKFDSTTGQYEKIVTEDTMQLDRKFRFQGYKIFQVKDETVGPDQLDNPDLAREIIQVDVKDSIDKIVNFEFDSDIGHSVPVVKADSVNQGISHSFKVTEDQFAQGDPELINHKKYHFIAVAYAHNNFKDFDPNDPDKLDGQKEPYLGSRQTAGGQSIVPVTGIPHIPRPEKNGTDLNAEYGDGIPVTRIEGQGNGGLVLDLTEQTEERLLEKDTVAHPTYLAGKGPIDIKVVDPLELPDARFELKVKDDTAASLDEAYWQLVNLDNGDTVNSTQTIDIRNEQLIPEWGISITVAQQTYTEETDNGKYTPPLNSSLEYADSSKQWLAGLSDQEGFDYRNWIRCGTQQEESQAKWDDYVGRCDQERYEQLIGGTWAPFNAVAVKPREHMPLTSDIKAQVNSSASDFGSNQSVDIVFTDNKSKWTRCPVLENQHDDTRAQGGAKKLGLRQAPSVDKNGNPDGSGTIGMGWFPGYAINLETGERLNMAFSEDSWLALENGRDMQWNPTSNMTTTFSNPTSPQGKLFGGKHYIYVFDSRQDIDQSFMPPYDQGQFIYDKIKGGFDNSLERQRVWSPCIWVGAPMRAEEEELLSTEARVRLRVAKKYEKFQTSAQPENNNNPMYRFDTKGSATETNVKETAKEMLDTIKVVPNPYYAFSSYEEDKLDNKIKIVNLPQECTVKIFNVSGTLIRTLKKDNDLTWLEWDLKNEARIPIASGVYIMHVDAPGIGEKVLKWFGVMRPQDLDNF